MENHQRTVQQIIDRIKNERSSDGSKVMYNTASQKDEVAVMKAMLNDDQYNVDLYNADGCNRLYCLSIEMKDMISKILSSQCDIPFQQAKKMVDLYEFDNEDAETMINSSKQFVTTYLTTGRKFSFDTRRNSEVSLTQRHVDAHTIFHPVKITHKDGTSEIVTRETRVPEYEQIRSISKCPTWKRNMDKNELKESDYHPYPNLYDGYDYYSQFGYHTILSEDNVYRNEKPMDDKIEYSSSMYNKEDEYDIYGRKIVMRIER